MIKTPEEQGVELRLLIAFKSYQKALDLVQEAFDCSENDCGVSAESLLMSYGEKDIDRIVKSLFGGGMLK